MFRAVKSGQGFITVEPKPTVEELSHFYAETYFQDSSSTYSTKYSYAEHTHREAQLELLHWILKKHFGALSGRRLLDVGCGEGWTLAFFHRNGVDGLGVDYSEAGLMQHNPDHRDSFSQGDVFEFLEREVETGNHHDIIILNHVLEHVLDPSGLLNSLHSILADDGLAVITVPNDYSWVQRAAREFGHISRDFWFCPPQHLNYFSRETLIDLAQQSGWNVLDALADFPIDWFLFAPGSNYARNPNVGRSVHQARVQLETRLLRRDPADVVDYLSSSCKLGVGRNITLLLGRGHSAGARL